MSGTKKNENEKDEIEDCGCYAESRNKRTCPRVYNVTHPLRYYEFTPEEIKALEECDKESFYQRCLPFSTLFATMTYAAIRTGLLSRSPHFGSVPKVMLAILFGHVCGRLSYMKNCDAKLRRLPAGSHLGDVMRQYHSQNSSPVPKKH